MEDDEEDEDYEMNGQIDEASIDLEDDIWIYFKTQEY